MYQAKIVYRQIAFPNDSQDSEECTFSNTIIQNLPNNILVQYMFHDEQTNRICSGLHQVVKCNFETCYSLTFEGSDHETSELPYAV